MYHDHHLHPLGYAGLLNGLDLFDAADISGVIRLVQGLASESEGAVIGRRLNDEGLAEARLPDRTELDDAVGDRPVLLYRYCGHVAVANSRALAMAGVTADTPDPEAGSFDRGPSGQPTGILREGAIEVVSSAIADQVIGPPDSAILRALGTLPSMGISSITGIVSIGEPLWCGVRDELGALCRLSPALPLDVEVLVIASDPGQLAEAADKIRQTNGRIQFLGWKGFADGSFGGHTAALHEPYSDRPDTAGTTLFDAEHFKTMARASMMLGGSVAIHAIGDKANDEVLDMYEDLIGMGAEPSRLRVEHASLLTDPAIERMGRLGVTASVQPAFLASEAGWLAKRLGDDRMGRVYPLRSLLEAGVTLIGGSDAPVEPPDPEIGINAATTRPGFNPSESLTEDQAISLFARG